MDNLHNAVAKHCVCSVPGGVSYFPYILLNEIKTMFSQLAKQSLRKLSADTSNAHEQYDADGNA